MRYFLILICSLPLMGQQLIIPSELNKEQAKTYKKVVQSISAPCCQNGIPVAYHESPMSNYLADMVRDQLIEGKSETQIMKAMADLEIGDGKLKVIFTVPQTDNIVGKLAWITPALIVLLGSILLISVYTFKKSDAQPKEALIDNYRDYIQEQVKAMK